MQSFISRYKSLFTFLAGLIVIAGIAFAFFYPDAAEGNQLRQHDMQQGAAIGQEAKAFTEATGEVSRWTNSLFSGMPNFQISPSYPSGRLFSWIGSVMSLGLPSPSSLIAMMMVGFFILLLVMKMRWYVALLGAIAYGFSSYFIIIIGAGHIWKFVTLAYIPPTIAGIILCYRGRYLAGGAMAALFAMMQIASNHVQMTYYFLFVIIGIVIATLVTALRSGTMRRWGIATGVLAVAAGLAVTANSPSLYLTYEYSKETMRGRHSELTQPSADPSNSTGGLDKDYITQYSYQPSETFSLLIPNIKGGASAKPEKGRMTPMGLSDLPDAKKMVAEGKIDSMQEQYLSYMSQYFGDPEGTNGPVYVGALIFALFLLGCVIVRGPMKWALLILTVFSIVLAWGRHAMIFTDIMLSIVPMYSKFRTVESILVIAEFTMPLLAAMALQQLVTDRDRLGTYRRPIIWCFGVTLAICAIAFIAPSMFGSIITDNDRYIDNLITSQLTQQGYDSATARQFSLQNPAIYSAVESLRHGLIATDAIRSFVITALGFVMIMLYMRRKISATVTMAAIGVIILGDLYTVNKRYLSHESFVPRQLTVGAPIAMTEADRVILQDTSMNYRVMDIPRFYSADPSYYHKMIGGYHAAKLTRYQDLIDRHLANFTTGTENDADWNVINMLNARYIVDMQGQPLRNPEALGNAWFVDRVSYVSDPDREMAALSAIDPATTAVADKKFEAALGASSPKTPGDTIIETSYAPNRLTYTASTARGGVAVFSEVYFPWGWKATVDGKEVPVSRVNYVLRAMPIPAGKHEIVMTFDPQSLHTTDTAATVAVILIYLAAIGAIVMAVRGKRRDADTANGHESKTDAAQS
ncbi:MAG: YfhO family protein [Duncaniella sp.]|uniref:YfhO family protein n=1 Tax=Duncaniella sp. TaxID=2518496 RepID=UPI0023C752BE|nr:YfhO family protein [Duncaniella sp.]MDE5988034.1 YfhO family protein [Duncaniella sp.]